MRSRVSWLARFVAAALALGSAPSAAQEAEEIIGVIEPQAGQPYTALWANHAGAPSDTSKGLVWRRTRVRVLETREGRARVAIVGWVDTGALRFGTTGQRT